MTSHPAYCAKFSEINVLGRDGVYRSDSDTVLGGGFFGQSSFSSLAVVREDSVVNVANTVKSREELQLFAPLGCGFQTGAGTVTELARASELDTVVVLGLGGVGQTALMVSTLLSIQVHS